MTPLEAGSNSDMTRTPDVSDQTVPGPQGEIPIRIYRATAQRPEPIGLVWCHGGAYAYGNLDMPESDWVATSLAARGISVLTVDYRLAPVPAWAVEAGSPVGTGRSSYPVARDETATVLAWADQAMTSLSPVGWALGGASAGGTLAASATMFLRDSSERLPHRLLLAYPLLHPVLAPYPAELQTKLETLLTPAPIPLDRSTVEAICLNYVGGEAHLLREAHAFPGGHDVTGYPPTLVVHSDVDTIRVSSSAFAAELADAGVGVESFVEPGTEHGHLNTPEVPGARRSIDRIAHWLTASWLAAAAGANGGPD